MTLEQLRIFIAVAEREHVTRAAAALNLTPSAVSAAVSGLEQRHGVALFDRVGRGIALTQAGRIFLEEARAVLARADAAQAVLAEISGVERGLLSLYASQTISAYWLPARLAAFRRAHPGVEIKVSVGNTAQAAAAVREGVAELAFVEGQVEDHLLHVELVGHDRLAVVAPGGHPWGGLKRIGPEDLRAADWVLRESGSGTRSEFEAVLPTLGVDPSELHVVLELPSNEAVRAAVEAGAGVTAISELVAAGSLRVGRLVEAKLRLPERPFSALSHRQRRRSAAAQAFMLLAQA
jgi:DNA-binding transcriptional LysR family regulator